MPRWGCRPGRRPLPRGFHTVLPLAAHRRLRRTAGDGRKVSPPLAAGRAASASLSPPRLYARGSPGGRCCRGAAHGGCPRGRSIRAAMVRRLGGERLSRPVASPQPLLSRLSQGRFGALLQQSAVVVLCGVPVPQTVQKGVAEQQLHALAQAHAGAVRQARQFIQ